MPTWLSCGFLHHKLLLDQSLLVRGSVSLLLGTVLGHVVVCAGEELLGGFVNLSTFILVLNDKRTVFRVE